jgi:predicted RNA binding protein YcfA (HicA-like mRNA interferase family)
MKLPRVSANKIIKILKKKGFKLVRQSGSHMIFRNSEGVRVTVPYHAGKMLHLKVLKNIMNDAKIAPEEI